jgi:very-short-patch-repair endonuclease
MAGQRNSGGSSWGAIASLAGAQHGVVSRQQLRRLGKGKEAINHAIATGRLHPVFRSVFCVGHPPLSRQARLLAAVLACGEGSVVSHGTAAAHLGLWERPPSQIDVIAPVEAGRKPRGIRRRHAPPPLAGERCVHEAVPCTTPSRTIVDIAGFVGESMLRRTIEQAAVHRVLDVAAIYAILDGPRRRGSSLLRRVLVDWRRYTPDTRLRSVLEARLLELLSRHGIPEPRCNVALMIGGERFEVDFLWEHRRAIVEADGGKYHDNPQARARDRRRDRLFKAAGYRVWRLGWSDLERRPTATMEELARQLQLQRSAVP